MMIGIVEASGKSLTSALFYVGAEAGKGVCTERAE